MNRSEVTKRDNLLVEYILDHKGANNAVSSTKIAKYLDENKYPTKVDTVSSILARLIVERHLPICSLNGKGYYWARTKSDIMECISHLQSRIDSLSEHIAHLTNFIVE